ncbi:DUF1254 domain-containing protein [Chelativorans sp. YIM 93263]|uniref:DUF1254 domain-containing protein n=1 Tax=Chelativorans sp. YIM 93263 TaxID=2906648 RepID=UPI0023798748|nr:DUF1254 domain-containing protein [Chelativorans sp. YIM 93263]
MYRLLFAIALGLVGAGIVHILILFMLPVHSVQDAWSRISPVAAPFETVQLSESPSADNLPAPDNPFLEAAACRFDLSDGAVRVQAEGQMPFWSLSIFNRMGNNVFSINDDASHERALDFVLTATDDGQQAREIANDLLEESIVVEGVPEEGIALVRVFVPDETWSNLARDFLRSLDCRPM